MSYEPLLTESRESSFELTTSSSTMGNDLEGSNIRDTAIHGPASDPNEPALADAGAVPSRKQRISDLFTILCAGCALISDGYANSLMTLINVVLGAQYTTQYTSAVSTRVSNALLIGEIMGQISIGLSCDYLGRKTAIIITTGMIILGLALCAGASGTSIGGMFWMLTVARGITGFGTGGEYPASYADFVFTLYCAKISKLNLCLRIG